jgi:hypothetical protein
METITIAHVTDLHISESLLQPNPSIKWPHRYGHDIDALFQLDAQLKKTKWDILVVSGDVSRVGSPDSFVLAKLWIEKEVDVGNHTLGLDLKKRGIPYVIVPGNHDRFNDRLEQDVLESYYDHFRHIKADEVDTFHINGIDVNFHLYDSSDRNGGFAGGMLDATDMVPKSCAWPALNIAVMHHHLFRPPGYTQAFGDLVNSHDALAYVAACGFDAILVGHTHIHYADAFSVGALGAISGDRRRGGRLARKVLSFIGRQDAIWPQIPSCRDGKRPTLSAFAEYLYIRDSLRRPIPAVSSFTSLSSFYNALRDEKTDFRDRVEHIRKRKILMSMAPSGCQAEALMKGFHLIRFELSNGTPIRASVEHHEYDPSGYTTRVRHFPMSQAKQPVPVTQPPSSSSAAAS